ncbi:RNA polymerase sigma factor [Dyadobacter tibetensis]|uniref:RNA polymerase sigma factor n=1 Tax=Dyadobacter tibetensis TaxID=1211851 RepID=UPI000472D24A|nr:sigma-70 family RNA polymerase sigma factor [Dyadobacter tibetensis]
MEKGRQFSEHNEDVWKRFKAGDQEAFTTLYNLHVDSVFNYGLKFCNDSDTVKDAIQEIFVDLYLTRENNKSSYQHLKFYLFLSLKRNLIKKMKYRRRFDDWNDQGELVAGMEFSIEYQFIERETNEEINKKVKDVLDALPAKQKEAIYLRCNESLDYAEIATIMDISIESVRKQFYRGIKAIRENLGVLELGPWLIACLMI